jgi:imidazole glycerol phosphate synthase glutamine amidotransferase subunit
VNVTLVDYGTGNVTSVERALARLGVASTRACSPRDIAGARTLVLPGVGHFAALVRGLDARSLRAPLLEALARGVPFLGICLGLQALYESSDEAPELNGLSVFPGRIRALPSSVKLPHMGWNRVRAFNGPRLFGGIAPDSYFYFAHTFAALLPGGERISATCSHGAEFVAAIERDNVFAVQFHPEKSGEAGAQVLRNFLSLAA